MAPPNLFAYDSSGTVLVVFDGREVLVHAGSDEAPKWRHPVDADLVGIGAARATVVTLEAQGKLTWWSGATGEVLETITLAAEPTALSVANDTGACAVVRSNEVAVIERGRDARPLAVPGATAAAWSSDGSRLAIGAESGEVRIVSAMGDPIGTAKLEDAVRSLCWSPAGFWIATSGHQVFRVAPDGATVEHITSASGMAPDCVCASTDGSMFAARFSDALVIALAYPSRDTVVQLSYMDRKVGGVAFGPGRLLGVGLLGGDGNIVDIPTKQLRRTDTFPGRTHNRWMLSAVIEPGALPGGAASAAPRARPPASEEPSPAPAKGGLSGAAWLGIVTLLIAAALLISQCV